MTASVEMMPKLIEDYSPKIHSKIKMERSSTQTDDPESMIPLQDPPQPCLSKPQKPIASFI